MHVVSLLVSWTMGLLAFACRQLIYSKCGLCPLLLHCLYYDVLVIERACRLF